MNTFHKDWLWGVLTSLRRFPETLLNPEVQRPGYIVGVPYLALLRVLVYSGAILRFLFHREEYTDGIWLLLAILFAICFLIILLDLKRSSLLDEAHQRWKWKLICLDIFFISVFYCLTRKLDSDFFLFYYLPIITTAEYLSAKRLQAAGVLVTMAFATTLALMVLVYGSPRPIIQVVFSHFLPREVFFILVVIVSSHLRLSDIYRSQHANQLKMILRVRTAANDLQEDKELLDVSLETAMEGTQARAGLIWLGTAGKQQNIAAVIPETVSSESIESISERLQPQDPCTIALIPGDKKTRNHRVLTVPLLTHNATVGCLCVLSDGEKRDETDKLSFLRALAEPIGSLLEKRKLQNALNEIVRISSCAAILDHELDALLNTLTHDKGCDYAAVSLVDEYMERIAMLRARNMAPRLIDMSCVNLSSNNILADVVRSGRKELFRAGQYDSRFDKEIYETFGYSEYHRLFAPLMVTGKEGDSSIVGVIEAGWHKDRQPTDRIVNEVAELGKKTAKSIGNNRTHVLLEAIAQRAIDIISADSASIHVYRGIETLFQAGAGRANRDFLKKHPPRRPDGIGWSAINTQVPVFIDDPKEMSLRAPHIYREGVRAIAAIPLLNMSSEGISGVLYLHFWEHRKFTKTVLQIEETFARQIEIVIQNYLLMKKTAETVESAWHVSFFQNFIQSLATVHDTRTILNKIALNALLYLPEVDCVTLYQYFSSERRFEAPPVMQGHFHYLDQMRTEIHEEDVPWLIVQRGVSNYISDLSEHEELAQSQHDHDKQRFVIRERIESSAQLVLRAHNKEIVGVLFVNYRKRHSFPIEERNALDAFANAGAIAIYISRLVSEERSQRNHLDQLRKIHEEISAPEALRDLADKVLIKLKDIVPYTKASLQFLDGDQRVLLAGKGFDLQYSGLHFVRPITQDPLIRQAIEGRTAKVISSTASEPLWESLAETSDVRSWICLPLIHSDEVIGILTIDHDQEDAYAEVNTRLLMDFAGEVAVQLRKAAMYERAKQRIESLELIDRVHSEVSSRVDASSWARNIATLIREGLHCDQCTIFGKEGYNGTSVLKVLATDGRFSHSIESRSYVVNTSTRTKSPVETALRDGRRLVLEDANQGTAADTPEPIEKRTAARAMLLAPMISGEHSIGVIVAEKNEKGHFKESHAIVLDAIARYSAVAIQRDRGFALLHKIGNQILKATDVHEVLHDIVLNVSSFMEVDSAAICLLGDDHGTQCHIPRSSVPVCQLPSPNVLDEITKFMITQPPEILVVNCIDNPLFEAFENAGFSVCCAIPLRIEAEAVGILYLFSCEPRDFSEAERSLLGSLATQAGLVIQKTRIHQTVEEKLRSTEKTTHALQRLLGVNMLASFLFHKIKEPVNVIQDKGGSTSDTFTNIATATDILDRHIQRATTECQNHGALAELRAIREEIRRSLRKAEDGLSEIASIAERISLMVTRIASSMDDYSSKATSTTSVDVCNLLTRALTRVRIDKHSETERCCIQTCFEVGDERIETYEMLLFEALVYIITNAVEAMPDGGVLQVLAERTMLHSREVIQITIGDNGKGIQPADQKKLFVKPFSSDKPTGFGFGLFFSGLVLDACGIDKIVESELGSGTKFKLFVPISRSAFQLCRDAPCGQ